MLVSKREARVSSIHMRASIRASTTINVYFYLMKKIGIKYCGGCNPGYERVEMIERVQFRFSDRFLFLRHDDPGIDVLILMSGCYRACAGENLNTTKIPRCSITGANDLESLVNWLESLGQKGDS
jgi:hypothetical protein